VEHKGKREDLNEETLRRLYVDEKKSITTIAKIFGCSDLKIRSRFDRYGITIRRRLKSLDRLDRETLYKLRVIEGASICEIAQIFSCSPSGIRSKCMRFGFK